MITKINSAIINGIEGQIVTVEIDVSGGLNQFSIIGLPDASVKESKERVQSAITNSELYFPFNHRIIANLAPADIKKEGSLLDLPIALAILMNTNIIKKNKLDDFLIVGELSLSGKIKPVKGILSITLLAKENNIKKLILPYDNCKEASVVDGIEIYPVKNLYETVTFLNDDLKIEEYKTDVKKLFENKKNKYKYDFNQVYGQETVKRALEIAAAGGHNILMIGPPGCGKTLLSKSLPSILPDLTLEEALETSKIHSVVGLTNSNNPLIVTRPFRNPHHTVSNITLVGGGSNAKPGEVSLAHNGILFLDELPEFKRDTLEVLRQPLENGNITVSRIKAVYNYPARFMLVAAMNPCPCGYYGHKEKACKCSMNQIQKYLNKISGPLLDRIDLHISVSAVDKKDIIKSNEKNNIESSADIKKRVNAARKLQYERYKKYNIYCNSNLDKTTLNKYCKIKEEEQQLLLDALNHYNLSIRAYDKILKVARTIADLENNDYITTENLLESINYRVIDKYLS